MTNNSNGTKVMVKNDVSTSNNAGRQLEMAKRQAILMRVVESEARQGRNPSLEKIAEIARRDPWISSRWPGYSGGQAKYDFNKVMALTRDDLKMLAMPYLARQLNILDDTTNTLQEMVKDSQLDDDTKIKAANALRGYVGEIAKIFALYAPKETHIKKQEITGTIDDFDRLRKQAEKELNEIAEESTIVDEDGNDVSNGDYE